MTHAVKISVHRRLDQPGFVIEIAGRGKTQQFASQSKKEAILLAESIRDYLVLGLPLEPLMGDSLEAAA